MIEVGSVTFGDTGEQTILLNGSFTPNWVIFVTGGLFGANESVNARGGIGIATLDYEWAMAHLVNSSTKSSRNYPGEQAFAVLDGSGGAPTVLGSVTGFDEGEIDVDITDANDEFQIGLICGD